MSVVFDNVSNCARIGGGSGFMHGNGPPGGSRFRPVDHKSPDSCSRSSASSIGENSDDSGGSTTGGGDSGNATEEVQSPYRGGSFTSMNALEEVLPIRRGISRFYNGKSKSFTSLLDTSSSSSVRDIAKPENAYSRRRRNLLAGGIAWDNSSKNRTCTPLKSTGSGSFKKTTNFTRTKLAFAISSMANGGPKTSSCMNATFSPPQSHRQTRCNGDFSAYRSLSLADLQQFCTPAASVNKPEAQPEKKS